MKNSYILLILCLSWIAQPGRGEALPADTTNAEQQNTVLQGKLQIKQDNSADARPTTPASIRLRGGLRINRNGGQSIWLQPQQARFDPITKQTMIELVQRQAPQQNRSLPAGTNRLLPLPAVPDSFFNIPQLPPSKATLPSLIDTGKFDQTAADLEDKFQSQKWRWSSDMDEASVRMDQAIADLHKRFALVQDRWQLNTVKRNTWVEGNVERQEAIARRAEAAQLRFEMEYDRHAEERAQRQQELAEKSKLLAEKTLPLPTLPESLEPPSTPLAYLPDAQITPDNIQTLAQQDDPDLPSKADRPPRKRSSRDAVISWDEWYARMAKDIKKPLLEAVNRHGNPIGKNTIRVTVKPGLRIQATVETPGGQALDEAVLEAYRSLIYTDTLEFPLGSKRQSVTFLVDHLHAAPGAAIDIDATELTGDVEHQQVSR